jgi:hypothetical protein
MNLRRSLRLFAISRTKCVLNHDEHFDCISLNLGNPGHHRSFSVLARWCDIARPQA